MGAPTLCPAREPRGAPRCFVASCSVAASVEILRGRDRCFRRAKIKYWKFRAAVGGTKGFPQAGPRSVWGERGAGLSLRVLGQGCCHAVICPHQPVSALPSWVLRWEPQAPTHPTY